MVSDREVICQIMSAMFDGADEHGIYPTTTAYSRLELLMQSARIEGIGWCHAHCCATLDAGNDPRTEEIPAVMEQAMKDFRSKDQPPTT